jgi:diguanylate cyclase (GGDEF)-like protein
MARIRQPAAEHQHKIAIIEDDAALRGSLARLYRREGHMVATAGDVDEARLLLRSWRPHLILADYYLEQSTSAEVLRELRDYDELAQVLLVTGYATDRPARQLLRELDIQGYHDKADGPDRLLVLSDAALEHYRAVSRLARKRAYLTHIVDCSAEIMALQPPEELLRRALRNAVGLLNAADGPGAASNSGLFVFGDPAVEAIAVRAGVGRFEFTRALRDLTAAEIAAVRAGLAADQPTGQAGFACIPLQIRDGERGCMLIDAESLPDELIVPCQLYARHVAQSLENVVLYQRATVDALTGLANRGHAERRLDEILRLASRTGTETAVMIADIDYFKQVNDSRGHAAGDQAIRRVADTALRLFRSSDVVARWGGEELVVVLPATGRDGAAVAAEKLRAGIEETVVDFAGTSFGVTVSIGYAVAQPGDGHGLGLVGRADRALYAAKRRGRNCVEGDQEVVHVENRAAC